MAHHLGLILEVGACYGKSKMSIRWVSYFPTSKNVSVINVRKQLPPTIVTELIDDTSTFRHLISVDESNISAIQELDSILKIDSKWTKFLKQFSVEITLSEIDEYDYFFIYPQRLDHGKEISFELSMPECLKCPWGASIITPIVVSDRENLNIEFSEVQRSLRLDIEFIVSRRLKEIFVHNNITGLNYEPVFGKSDLYLARIDNEAFHFGKRIVCDSLCRQHLVTVAPSVVNRGTPIESFESDFVIIRGIEIDRKRYFTHPPEWVVSRKCLKILLDEVPNLQRITVRLDEPFKPCF